jgi:hypothetical protein
MTPFGRTPSVPNTRLTVFREWGHWGFFSPIQRLMIIIKLIINRMCRFVRPQTYLARITATPLGSRLPALLALGVVSLYIIERGPCLALDTNP